MAQVAGPESDVGWGTIGWILVPGVLVGALLGWAEHLRRTAGRRGWRWLALAPLLFASVLVPGLLDPSSMFESGIGGGAIGVPLVAMLGGYALSGRGPAWGRTVSAVLALSSIPVWALTASSIDPALALTTPRGTWVALYYWSFLALLAFACAIPHRPVDAAGQSPLPLRRR